MIIPRWAILWLVAGALALAFVFNTALQINTLSKLHSLESQVGTLNLQEQPSAPEIVAQAPNLSPVALTNRRPVPTMIPGWKVKVFPGLQVATISADQLVGNHAGEFVHTADWFSMNEHLSHNSVFSGEKAAFVLDGFFEPTETGNYMFAAHMKVNRAGQQHRLSVRCTTKVLTQDGQVAAHGALVADGSAEKAAVQGDTSVLLEAGFLHPVTAMVSCDLPHNVRPADVMVRICVREANQPSFRPLRTLTPYV